VATELVAEMVANVLTLVAEQGQRLQAGDTVLILESMKMEIPVLVEAAGTLTEIRVREGDVVQEGDILAVLT
jgi:acetyl-CoA carboxylase biotin carboxyl carrier protein